MKRKNLARDILKIIDKYSQLLNKPKDQNLKEEVSGKAPNSNLEGLGSANAQQTHSAAPPIKNEQFEPFRQKQQAGIRENPFNIANNPSFQNYQDNFRFFASQGFRSLNTMNAFADPRNPYINLFYHN